MLKKLDPDKKYVSFDDPSIEAHALDEPETFMMLNSPPVIFDEVQRVTDLFRYIKIKCDEEKTKDFSVLDKKEGKKRGTGAIICMCPQPRVLHENILHIHVWYV